MLYGFLVFIVGICFGNFLNVLVPRLAKQISENKINWKKAFGIVGETRSICLECQKQIRWYHNLPLVSYIFLQGKCFYCRSPIPRYYFFQELLTGFIFVLVYSRFFNKPLLLAISLLISLVLIFIFFFDWLTQLILDEAILFLVLLSLVYLLLLRVNLFNRIIASAGSGIILYLVHWLTKGKGMGFGDVKLAFFIGFFLGWPMFAYSLYLAFLLGGLTGGILLLLRRARLKQKVAFGPFLVTGVFISWLLNDQLVFIINQWLGF